jgi:4-amino-4-deoxy-L-arabinose transferase-like glycosyltransferase
MSVQSEAGKAALGRSPESARPFAAGVILILGFGLLLLATDLMLPLRVSELLQLLAAWHFNWNRFVEWIVQTPGSAPLTYFVQLPLLLLWPHARLAARLPSLIFAAASCFVFLSLAKRFSLKLTPWALVAFMLVPLHYHLASEAAPFELALFLLLAATLSFLDLLKAPNIKRSIVYGAFLTLALYTEPYSFFPAIGYLLFLLRFVDRAHERRVIWFVLPASAVSAALFLPYYAWAHPQASDSWPTAPAPSIHLSFGLQLLQSLADSSYSQWLAVALFIVLAAGAVAGTASTFSAAVYPVAKRIGLFCVAGGVLTTILMDLLIGSLNRRFNSVEMIWALPGFVILFCSGVEWLFRRRTLALVGLLVVAAVVAISVPLDADYLFAPKENLQAEAASVTPLLKGDSCVVFVSEGLSKELFLSFAPDLERHECLDFFHRRIVMVSHPYVRPDQQQDAESFFRGLGFHEESKVDIGGGRIIVAEQAK